MAEETWQDDEAEGIIFSILSELWNVNSEKLKHTWISHNNDVIFFSHRE